MEVLQFLGHDFSWEFKALSSSFSFCKHSSELNRIHPTPLSLYYLVLPQGSNVAAGWASKAPASVDSSSQSATGDNLVNMIPLHATVWHPNFHHQRARHYVQILGQDQTSPKFQLLWVYLLRPIQWQFSISQGPGRKQKPHANSPEELSIKYEQRLTRKR